MARLKQVLRSATNVSDPYCPDVGDIIDLNFDPQTGREQAGRRPALVLSPRRYNQLSQLCIVCPITTQAKGFPFEVALPEGIGTTGVVLSDHMKSLSWQARMASFRGRLPAAALAEVKAKIAALLGMN